MFGAEVDDGAQAHAVVEGLYLGVFEEVVVLAVVALVGFEVPTEACEYV